jgi:hypothetical protein
VDVTDIETTKDGILTNHGVIVQSKEVCTAVLSLTLHYPLEVPFPFAIKTASSGKTFVALLPPPHLILMDGT